MICRMEGAGSAAATVSPRATAPAMRDDPEAGLVLLDELTAAGEVGAYHLLPAAVRATWPAGACGGYQGTGSPV
ncbi:hypothetical protein ACFVKC_24260 [Streptomyces noursei]|uniref:hypothetical protein n=2 Tax=Streptomyces noursei TaxID=1971 RepID=UPI00363EF4F0